MTRNYSNFNARLKRRVSARRTISIDFTFTAFILEPGGVLFEFATECPGRAADEPWEKFGERLSIPPFMEVNRNIIDKGLKSLPHPAYILEYE